MNQKYLSNTKEKVSNSFQEYGSHKKEINLFKIIDHETKLANVIEHTNSKKKQLIQKIQEKKEQGGDIKLKYEKMKEVARSSQRMQSSLYS